RYLLSSLVVCHCGSKRNGKISRNRHRDGSVYEVLSYACSTGSHHGMSVVTRRVDGAVAEWLKQEANAPAYTPKGKSNEVEAKRISREITALEKQLTQATRQLLSGIIPEPAYRATVAEIEAEKAVLNERLMRLSRSRRPNRSECLTGKEELIGRWHLIDMDD